MHCKDQYQDLELIRSDRLCTTGSGCHVDGPRRALDWCQLMKLRPGCFTTVCFATACAISVRLGWQYQLIGSQCVWQVLAFFALVGSSLLHNPVSRLSGPAVSQHHAAPSPQSAIVGWRPARSHVHNLDSNCWIAYGQEDVASCCLKRQVDHTWPMLFMGAPSPDCIRSSMPPPAFSIP